METLSVAESIKVASLYAEPGDVIVLLSPACASFDLFKSYIDRGDQSRRAFTAKKDTGGRPIPDDTINDKPFRGLECL